MQSTKITLECKETSANLISRVRFAFNTSARWNFSYNVRFDFVAVLQLLLVFVLHKVFEDLFLFCFAFFLETLFSFCSIVYRRHYFTLEWITSNRNMNKKKKIANRIIFDLLLNCILEKVHLKFWLNCDVKFRMLHLWFLLLIFLQQCANLDQIFYFWSHKTHPIQNHKIFFYFGVIKQ